MPSRSIKDRCSPAEIIDLHQRLSFRDECDDISSEDSNIIQSNDDNHMHSINNNLGKEEQLEHDHAFADYAVTRIVHTVPEHGTLFGDTWQQEALLRLLQHPHRIAETGRTRNRLVLSVALDLAVSICVGVLDRLSLGMRLLFSVCTSLSWSRCRRGRL